MILDWLHLPTKVIDWFHFQILNSKRVPENSIDFKICGRGPSQPSCELNDNNMHGISLIFFFFFLTVFIFLQF